MNGYRRIATYERTSSEDQRERATIKTQSEEIARRLAAEPGVELVERYVDDGVSGTIPMAKRAAGSRFMRDAARGRFEEVWVFRIDRLGRDDIDPLIVWRELEQLGVKVYSVTEGVSTPFEYTIRVAMNAEERRAFLARSAAGMNRAASEGRYTGGIVSFGYMVVGKKPDARLAPSDLVVCGDMTEADVVRHMFRRLAIDGWACRRVAEELNALGVPTHYRRDGRGVRGKRTKGVWTAGRVLRIITEPIYRGERLYGRHAIRPREVISAPVEALVSVEMWEAAQETLRGNRIMPKNTTRVYLLRRVLRCHHCGRYYSGSWHPRDGVRYICNGAGMYKQLQVEKCLARSIRGRDLEEPIWADVERWLRNPGDVLDDLRPELEAPGPEAVWEAERATLDAALAQRRGEKDRLLDAYQAGAVPLADLKPRMDEADEQVRALERRLAEVEDQAAAAEDPIDVNLLAELRQRLDAGLDDRQRQQIVQLLVSVELTTEHDEGRRKRVTAVVTYKFPRVVNDHSGTG